MSRFTETRQRIKAGLEASLVRSRLAQVLRLRVRRRGLVLAYHGIVPRGERAVGERSLHVPEAQFIAQISVLEELTRVVPLGELLQASGSDGPPRVAITWDDAYAGALSCGVAALAQRGIPATLFIAPGRIGGQSFWWDRLAERSDGILLGSIRQSALVELAGEDEAVAGRYERGARPVQLPDFARSADDDLLSRAAARAGVSICSHSWSHVNLAAVSRERVEEELTLSARWLAARFPSWRPMVAYPYGKHSPDVEREAARAGYRAGFRIEGGWLPREGGGDPFRIPRLNVAAGLSLDGFVLRLSGLFA